MLDNPDWLDWLVTQPHPGEYDPTIVQNTNSDSVTDISSIGVNGVYTLPNTVKALDTFQVALYVDSAVALTTGDYRVSFEVSPIA